MIRVFPVTLEKKIIVVNGKMKGQICDFEQNIQITVLANNIVSNMIENMASNETINKVLQKSKQEMEKKSLGFFGYLGSSVIIIGLVFFKSSNIFNILA